MMTQHTALKSTKLLKNLNYGKGESREIQIRKEYYLEEKGRLGRLFTRPNVKIKYYLARDSGFEIQDCKIKVSKCISRKKYQILEYQSMCPQ